MALRAPTVAVTRLSVTLRFPDPAASSTVRDQSGARVALDFGSGPVPGIVAARSRATLEVEATPEPDTPRPAPGDAVVVSWTELNDLASVRGEVEVAGTDRVDVVCSWPPQRVQRRAFRRFPMALPVWLVRTSRSPDAPIVHASTCDLSGGGVGIDLPGTDLVVGEQLVLVLRCDDADMVLPATVHSLRPEQTVVGVRFTRISQSDQDHLVRLVTLAEAARGR